MRARLLHGSDDALGALSPWSRRRLREVSGPHGALAHIAGEGEAGYLDGVPPERIAHRLLGGWPSRWASCAARSSTCEARWIIAGWPTDHWAGQVYPELEPLKAKRRLADDLLRFCRLDRRGRQGNERLDQAPAHAQPPLGAADEARPRPARAARAGHRARRRLRGGHALARRLRDARRRPEARGEHADGGGLHEPGPAPDDRDLPLHVPALVPRPADPRAPRRVLEGAARPARGRLGRRSRLRRRLHRHRPEGRRLGEVALVDASSRIGQTGRIYYNTLLDENAAAHIAFGSGFGGTRSETPRARL